MIYSSEWEPTIIGTYGVCYIYNQRGSSQAYNTGSVHGEAELIIRNQNIVIRYCVDYVKHNFQINPDKTRRIREAI